MPTQSELRKVLFAAARAGRKELLKYYGKLKLVECKDNDETNIVTVADKEAEAAILRTIRRAFPGHGFLCEESGAGGTACAEYCWVIDPLDGTTNFAHGMPLFSISIGLQKSGETILGLVVDVFHDEWFYARRNGGAFLNNRRIHVSGAKTLGASLLITGFPHGRRKRIEHFMRVMGGMMMHSRNVLRLGSCAIDLCYVACGRADGFWQEGLQPWDFAAGNLIVEEAGGRVSTMADRPRTIEEGDLVATNGRIHGETLEVLRRYCGAD